MHVCVAERGQYETTSQVDHPGARTDVVDHVLVGTYCDDDVAIDRDRGGGDVAGWCVHPATAKDECRRFHEPSVALRVD